MSQSQAQEASEHASYIAQTGNLSVKASDLDLIKQHLIEDPFDFAKIICQYTILTDAYHRPLSYIVGGCVDKLIALLNRDDFPSYVLSTLRIELARRDIDFNTPEGRARFAELLEFVNIRFYRGSGKSSIGTHATLLWYATKDPNETIALMSVNDDGAHAFLRQIRDTCQSDLYKLFFPDRVPKGDLSKLWTEERMWLGGRSIPHPQWTIEARGFTSSWARTHFNRFFTDDIVTEANCSPTELAKVHRNLGNMRGLYMPAAAGRKICRHHLGTIYDEEDDHGFLRKIEHCLSLVVPIEIYPKGQPESIKERGIPTNPEWHDTTEIDKIAKEVSGDPKQGPLSYKRNFWLDPTAGTSDRIFPSSLVAKSQYEVRKTVDAHGNQQAHIVKKAKQKDGSVKETLLDPGRDLFIALGIDPAFSLGQAADEWAITALGTDSDEISYQLKTIKGKGWAALKAAMILMIRTYHPKVVGYERAGQQEQNFKTLLEYDSFFRRYASIFVAVTHDNTKKELRIINQVSEPMQMDQLLLNPNAIDLHDEMRRYIPGPKAVDNQLDSVAIARAVSRKGRSSGGWKQALLERKRRNRAKRDPITGVMVA